jgi:hypothetical protein
MKPKSRTKFVVFLVLSTLACVSPSGAGALPRNLGNGLTKLLRDNQSIAGRQTTPANKGSGRADSSGLMQFDDTGRVLVDILLDAALPFEQTRRDILARSGTKLRAENRTYRGGVIEAWLSVDQIAVIARTPGVSALHASLAPRFNVGAVTSQGVVQHRVDQIPQYDGSGITIGVISDSFDTNLNTITRASDDIASGDLPAEGVTLLQDSGVGNDEGRGMCQVIHDMAPGVKLGFATANGGEVNFANNIRSLAGLPSGTNRQPGFKADVVVDDTFYVDEPYFSEGITSAAIEEVSAAGVSYFSAAGNSYANEGYLSDFRLVPFDPANPDAALAGTNLDLTGVDPALYAGGFHNFNPVPGQQDIAQSLQALFGDVFAEFQWDDPYDVTLPPPLQTIFTGSGTATNDADGNPIPADVVFQNNHAGATYRIDLRGFSDQTGNPPVPLDATITVLDPHGKVLTGDGEINPTLILTFAESGPYIIRITGNDFLVGDGADTGPFDVKVSTISPKSVPPLTTDFNLLLFDADGHFIGALGSDNLANHRPIEVGPIVLPDGVTDCQLVIARANTPPSHPRPASRLHYDLIDAHPTEYLSYLTPTISGHETPRETIAVGAYSPFRPYIPETYTSTGPCTILFDSDGRRLAHPDVREKPDVSAMDGANTTFFGSDTTRDSDTFPNFFGTSCAAPHAAAIGALVLQAHGGPGTVSPSQMKSVLQQSAFMHDLDPVFAEGVATASNGGRVVVSSLENGTFTDLNLVDPNENAVTYDGPGSLVSITFDASGGNVTGGSEHGSFPGLVFDQRIYNGQINSGLPFLFGDSIGLTAGDVTPTYDDQAPLPSQPGVFYQMTLTFAADSFTSGDLLHFAIDRDEQHSAFQLPRGSSRNGDSADLLGGGVLIPQGDVLSGGVTFSGTLSDGSTFSGIYQNRIGAGYSILDGYGFVNADKAVSLPLPALPLQPRR